MRFCSFFYNISTYLLPLDKYKKIIAILSLLTPPLLPSKYMHIEGEISVLKSLKPQNEIAALKQIPLRVCEDDRG